MDNSAIERIATTDLADDTLELLKRYYANDDVVFFLGRLVWQGRMDVCAPHLLAIAADTTRGRYARIAAIRGVMSVGDSKLKDKLWNTIAKDSGPLDRALFAELLDWTPPTSVGVELVLQALERVAPDDHATATGLEYSLHEFVNRLPVMADAVNEHPLARFVSGLNRLLGREPYVKQDRCHISKEFMWLMPTALHAVDRLVAARSVEALKAAPVAVLNYMPALRFWRGGGFEEYNTSLSQNVPRWRELNDLLYWISVADFRARMATEGKALRDDLEMSFVGHFWKFGPEDFERCIEWVSSKDGDDRFVSLSRCIQIYFEANRPAAWLASLRAVVAESAELSATLEASINSKRSRALEMMEKEVRRRKRRNAARNRRQTEVRADWVRALKSDPDRVLRPRGLKPGDFSEDQFCLLRIVMSDGLSSNREHGTNWRVLIPEFGEPVARAFRDAAVAHWRAYRPTLRSEGGGNSESTPYSLIFAMTGLAIEAAEDSAFAQGFNEEDARLAFRYVTWEMNGFPSWFEPLYRAFPVIGRKAVSTELVWELQQSNGQQPLHYILQDILYHAPWLHGEVAPLILEWLRKNDVGNSDVLRCCLNILAGSGAAREDLSSLAAERVRRSTNDEQRPQWFALWADTDPAAAIPALEAHLGGASPADASIFAQQFIVALLGDRHGTGSRIAAYRNAKDLKTLYVIMHRYIRIADDIDRIGKGVYSPTLRDNAQHARSALFNMLVDVPGQDAYAAMKALEEEHPEPDYRRWMAVRARQRATQDADEPLWSTEEVRNFVRLASGGSAT